MTDETAILSIVIMWRESCITKEAFDIEYGIKEGEKIEVEDREDISVGEDLETFIKRIKNGQVNEITVPNDGESNEIRLLCLLDAEKRKKLEKNDKDYIRTFESGIAEDAETEYPDLKFAMSQAWRRTFIIDARESDLNDEDQDEDQAQELNKDLDEKSDKYRYLSHVEQFRLF